MSLLLLSLLLPLLLPLLLLLLVLALLRLLLAFFLFFVAAGLGASALRFVVGLSRAMAAKRGSGRRSGAACSGQIQRP